MTLLETLLHRAERGGISLWLLNMVLLRVIPFNRPLGVRVISLTKNEIIVHLPYKRSNFNHLRGLHACALATAAEYACGLLLLRRMGSGKYRLIMKHLSSEYLYQGKSDATVRLTVEESWFETQVVKPLEHQESVEVPLKAHIVDEQKNELCITELIWQVKAWDAVRTPR